MVALAPDNIRLNSLIHIGHICSVFAGLLHRCICTAQPCRHHKTTTRAACADRICDRTLRNIHHHHFFRHQHCLPFPATQRLHHPAPFLHHSAAANNSLRGYLAICEQPHYQGTRHGPRGSAALYSISSLGSALGAFASGFLLVPVFGFKTTSAIAGVINIGAGLLLLILAIRTSSEPTNANQHNR